MHRIVAIILVVCAFSVVGAHRPALSAEPLMIFCGAAFKRPMEDIVSLYQKQKGERVNVIYGGVGTLFSQILLSRQGDVFVVPSPDIMERAKTKGVIIGDSVRNIAYVAPCINTQKGNPKNIKGLRDLARPGIRVGLANPEIVYIGAIAAEIVEKSLPVPEKKAFRQNVVASVEDFNKLATLVVLKQVDAIIGFHFLEGWYPDKVTMVKLKPDEILRIGSAQAAVVGYTSKRDRASAFIDFLTSDGVRAIFRKYHYFGTAQEAFSWVGGTKPIGGEFALSKEWTAR